MEQVETWTATDYQHLFENIPYTLSLTADPREPEILRSLAGRNYVSLALTY